MQWFLKPGWIVPQHVAWNTEPWNSKKPPKNTKVAQRKRGLDSGGATQITAVRGKSQQFNRWEKERMDDKRVYSRVLIMSFCDWMLHLIKKHWRPTSASVKVWQLFFKEIQGSEHPKLFVATFKEATQKFGMLKSWMWPTQKNMFFNKSSNLPEKLQILSGQCYLQSNSQMSTRTGPWSMTKRCCWFFSL